MKCKIRLELEIHKRIILYELICMYRYVSLCFLLILLYMYLRMCVQCTFSNALSKIPTSYSLYTNFFSLLRDMVTEFDDGKATTAKVCSLLSEIQNQTMEIKNIWF